MVKIIAFVKCFVTSTQPTILSENKGVSKGSIVRSPLLDRAYHKTIKHDKIV
ncbi:hypothetical protein [Geminocystis herdmanii]|uniref:hypothetical protein n=1 Tax=Geminocystis herdmanii TaxID=669359 RepID=UPI00034C4AE9|nr:hypothetical protein [Geminocystis herdmanii]